MARLLLKTEGGGSQPLELNLGVNRIGRSPDCEFQIEHPTVSTLHCEAVLTAKGVILRDCKSTNGTFLNGDTITEVFLAEGQTIHVGDVELLVESTEVRIEIPESEVDRPMPPVMQHDGTILCARHPEVHVTYRCTHCAELMCANCVRVVKRKGGRGHALCPLCSHPCQLLEQPKETKKSLFQRLKETVQIPFSKSKARLKGKS